MLVLFESSAGYVLFKADDGKLKRAGDDINAGFEAGAGEMASKNNSRGICTRRAP